jgi:glycosyltransferase involved in cell wall biosynthesis
MRVMQLAWPTAEVKCIPLPSRSRSAHRLRQAWCLLRSAVGGTPAKIAFAHDRRLRRELLHDLTRIPPDLVIVNGSDLLWLLPLVPRRVRVFLIVHNIEHELYRSKIAAVVERWPRLTATLERDWRALRRFEWSSMRNVDGAIFLSDADRSSALAACPALPSLVIPPVFDYQPNPRAPRTGEKLIVGMFADFTWWPNLTGLRWFLREVWPALDSHIELHLFGFGSSAVGAGIRRVHSYGFVEDQREPFDRCDLMIAPIVSGAGIKVKVAEALHNGVPVIATPFALRGLPINSDDAVHSADSPEQWIRFLNSGDARSLAQRRVSAGTASYSSPQRFAPALREFHAGNELSDEAASTRVSARAGSRRAS